MSDQDIADELRALADEIEADPGEELPDGWSDDPDAYPSALHDRYAPYKTIGSGKGFVVVVDSDGDPWVVRDGTTYCMNPTLWEKIAATRDEAREHFNEGVRWWDTDDSPPSEDYDFDDPWDWLKPHTRLVRNDSVSGYDYGMDVDGDMLIHHDGYTRTVHEPTIIEIAEQCLAYKND